MAGRDACQNFHMASRQIAHPACHIHLVREALSEIAEANTLHEALDNDMKRWFHPILPIDFQPSAYFFKKA